MIEDDFDNRTYFWEQMTVMLDNNVFQLKNVWFSDECPFTLYGNANRQNYRYRSRENAHWMRWEHTQSPGKVNVWTGIVGDHMIGPLFFDGNLSGDKYLALLENIVIPTLLNL